MRLYADLPARRFRQIVADVLALGWVVVCVAVGRAVHGALAGLAEPLRRVADVGEGIDTSMSEAAGRTGDLPLLGERVSAPFRDAAAAGQRLSDAGVEAAGLVEALAVVVAVLIAALPALAVLVPWLVQRLRFARGAGETRRLASSSAGRDLLALRALVTRPPAELAAVAPDAVAAWRAGDPEVARRLAALQLARSGIVQPKPQMRGTGR